ncbi:MAG: prepilin-type N-terminal cleavage/methylation domain-containing protein [Oscillospiraceae bacterium]
MLKKLQALKAKKGFTLVELIVVIAIIGVLAAILVPTMLGYVTSSRVTSANSTAASIKNNIGTFLTNADTAGYGMKQANDNIAKITIEVTDDGTWNVTQEGGDFKTGSSVSWSGSGSGTANQTKSGVDNAEDLLAIELANLFPDTKSVGIVAYIKGGSCSAVAYTADDTAIADDDMPAVTDGEFSDTFEWDTKTAGVAPSGIIVGTAPAVPLG